MTTPRYCAEQISGGGPGSANMDPPDYCDQEAEPGSDYCADHSPNRFLDDADRLYEEARDRRLEEMD